MQAECCSSTADEGRARQVTLGFPSEFCDESLGFVAFVRIQKEGFFETCVVGLTLC